MIVTAVAILFAVAGGGHKDALSLSQYQRAVHTARVTLDRRAGSASIRQVQAAMRRLDRVSLPDGRVVQTNLPHLAGELAPRYPASVGAVAAQLDALDDDLRALRAAPANPADLRTLDDVLRDPRFHPAVTPWQYIMDRLADLYRRLIEWLAADLHINFSSNGIGSALVVLCSILLVGLVGGVGYLVARGALARMVVEAGAEEEDEQGPATARAAEGRAAERAAAEDYRAALRYLFLATMLSLQESGALELRPGMTNREYLRLLRTERYGLEVQTSLNDLIDLFDAVWYGHRPVGAAEYRRAEGWARQAIAALRTAAA